MTPRYTKVEAFILKRRNSGESDKILTIFTKEYGKLRVAARGIRKITSKRAPHLEVFSRVNMVLHKGKILDIVGEVDALDVYSSLRKTLERASIAYYMSELIDALIPEKQEYNDVFALLQNTFEHLDALPHRRLKEELYAFSNKLLRLLGYLEDKKMLRPEEVTPYIESIIERDLKTPKILRQLVNEL